MTTSIISEAKKSWKGIRTRRFKDNLLKSRIDLLKKNFNFSWVFLNFSYYVATDKPMDKVNYIRDAHWYRESSHKKSAKNFK